MQDRQENTGAKTVFSGLASAPQVKQTVEKAKSVAGKVRVIHGSNENYFPLDAKTVGKTRKGLKDAFNIPGDALAKVDGKEVGDDFVLAAGQTLEFSKAAGDKGDKDI